MRPMRAVLTALCTGIPTSTNFTLNSIARFRPNVKENRMDTGDFELAVNRGFWRLIEGVPCYTCYSFGGELGFERRQCLCGEP